MPSTTTDETPLILTQIAERLHEVFDGSIALDDVNAKAPEEIEAYFRSRAFAALAIVHAAEVTPSVAGNCITDGGADDGIDAIYVDKASQRVYFVQSKWRRNLKKGIELSDFTRLRDGVESVLSLNWTSENANLHRFRAELETALKDIDTHVVIIIAHTGEMPIARNIKAKIDAFISQQNKFVPDFVEYKEFTLVQAARTARSYASPHFSYGRALVV